VKELIEIIAQHNKIESLVPIALVIVSFLMMMMMMMMMKIIDFEYIARSK
jgi:hypothetical protein